MLSCDTEALRMRTSGGRLQYHMITQGEDSSGVAQDTVQASTTDQKCNAISNRASLPVITFEQGYSESLVSPNITPSASQQKALGEAEKRKQMARTQHQWVDQSQLKKVQVCVQLFDFRGKTTQQRVRLQKEKIIQQRKWRKQHPAQLIVPAHLRFQEPHIARTKTIHDQPDYKDKLRYIQARPEDNPIKTETKSNCKAEQLLRKACTKTNKSSKTNSSSKPLRIIPKVEKELPKQQELLQRRMALQNGRIDLGVTSLFQIVEYAHSHHLLSNQLYFQFVNQYTEETNTDFIRSLSDHSLSDWNFMAYKITPADHRRIALLLAKLYPAQFVIGKPLFLSKRVDEFMKLIYSVPTSEYFNLMGHIDRKLKVAWWKPISVKHHRALAEIYRNIPYSNHSATIQDASLIPNRLNQLSQHRPAFLTKKQEKDPNKVCQQPRQRKLSEFYFKQQEEEDQVIWKQRPTKLRKGY